MLGEKFNLVAEVPITHFGFNNSDAESNIGNLYLGAQLKTQSDASVMSAIKFGVDAPTASDDNFNGFVTNLFDYPEYLDQMLSAHVSYNSFHFTDSHLRIGYELGLDLAIPIGFSSEDTELYGKYGLSLMYETDSRFYVQTELLGIAILTEDGDFDENTIHT